MRLEKLVPVCQEQGRRRESDAKVGGVLSPESVSFSGKSDLQMSELSSCMATRALVPRTDQSPGLDVCDLLITTVQEMTDRLLFECRRTRSRFKRLETNSW